MELFLKGLIAGFIVAMPSGPVSVLIFRRVLTGSLLVGLATVFGGAAADTVYGMVAALGISAITHLISAHRTWLRLFAGVFLLVFGVIMLRSHAGSDSTEEETTARDVHRAFLATFGMMMVNPVVIFSYFGVFGWLDLSAHHPGWLEGSLLAAGLFLGSSCWWLVWKGAFFFFGERLRRHGIHAINVGAGSLICVFGVWELVAALVHRH